MRTTANLQQLYTTLEVTNRYYGYTLSFRKLVPGKVYTTFLLKAESGSYGSRNSVTGRSGPWASWYAHGHFFDVLLQSFPAVKIWSAGKQITLNSGNWQEIPVGGRYESRLMSQLTN
jgi:hypothetical protein